MAQFCHRNPTTDKIRNIYTAKNLRCIWPFNCYFRIQSKKGYNSSCAIGQGSAPWEGGKLPHRASEARPGQRPEGDSSSHTCSSTCITRFASDWHTGHSLDVWGAGERAWSPVSVQSCTFTCLLPCIANMLKCVDLKVSIYYLSCLFLKMGQWEKGRLRLAK